MKKENISGLLLFVSYQVIVKGINSVLIILSVMEVCVSISSVVLGIKALRNNPARENEVQNHIWSLEPIKAKWISVCFNFHS